MSSEPFELNLPVKISNLTLSKFKVNDKFIIMYKIKFGSNSINYDLIVPDDHPWFNYIDEYAKSEGFT